MDGVHACGDVVALGAADARKLTVVLRRRHGDTVEIGDSAGNVFAATVDLSDGGAAARLVRVVERPAELKRDVVLCQAVPKGAKMDFVIEKATELGVARILPVVTERTIPRAAAEGRVDRWRRLARTAAAQCGRTKVPVVDAPRPWADVIVRVTADHGVVLVPWELAGRTPLRQTLPPLLARPGTVAVLIGPEGGISHDEAEAAFAAGAHAVSLGPRIFRTETAGLVVLSALLYEMGDL